MKFDLQIIKGQLWYLRHSRPHLTTQEVITILKRQNRLLDETSEEFESVLAIIYSKGWKNLEMYGPNYKKEIVKT